MKKKKGNIITEHIKAVGVRLKGFMDWLDSTVSDLAEEREKDMSSLTAGFLA